MFIQMVTLRSEPGNVQTKLTIFFESADVVTVINNCSRRGSNNMQTSGPPAALQLTKVLTELKLVDILEM